MNCIFRANLILENPIKNGCQGNIKDFYIFIIISTEWTKNVNKLKIASLTVKEIDYYYLNKPYEHWVSILLVL